MRFGNLEDKWIKGKRIEGINNEKGERQDQPQKIKEVYKEFHQKLLITERGGTNEEKEIESVVEKTVEAMKEIAEMKKIELIDREV